MHMARIFVAFEPSPEARQALAEAAGEIARVWGGAARLTRVEQLHLTVAFCGEIEVGEVPAVVAAVRAVPPLGLGSVALGETGVFPPEGDPRVVWVGIRDPGGLVAGAAAKLEGELRRRGFAVEERAFVPHITLARIRDGETIPGARRVIGRVRVPSLPIDVSALTVFSSERGAGGSVHTPIERVNLSLSDNT